MEIPSYAKKCYPSIPQIPVLPDGSIGCLTNGDLYGVKECYNSNPNAKKVR